MNSLSAIASEALWPHNNLICTSSLMQGPLLRCEFWFLMKNSFANKHCIGNNHKITGGKTFLDLDSEDIMNKQWISPGISFIFKTFELIVKNFVYEFSQIFANILQIFNWIHSIEYLKNSLPMRFTFKRKLRIKFNFSRNCCF